MRGWNVEGQRVVRQHRATSQRLNSAKGARNTSTVAKVPLIVVALPFAHRDGVDKYNGVILLFFILASVLLISLVDTHIIPMEHVRPGERATMRLLGIFYMMAIFIWIKYVYNDANYDTIIMYFVTLIIGRFIPNRREGPKTIA